MTTSGALSSHLRNRGKVATLVALAVVAGLAAALVSYATAPGIGLGSDSAVYFAGAKHILNGPGYAWLQGGQEAVAINWYPPFYSVSLAVTQTPGLEPREAARMVNVFSFAVSVVLCGWLIRLSGGSQVSSVLGAFLVSVSPELIRAHSWAMSEPIFTSLSLAALGSLGVYLDRRSSGILIASALLASFSFLTRYAGLAVMVAGVASLVFDKTTPGYRGLRRASSYLFLTLVPSVAWIVRNIVATGSATGRIVGWHVASALDTSRAVTVTILDWWLPSRIVERGEVLLSNGSLLSSLALVALALMYVGGMTIAVRLLTAGKPGSSHVVKVLGAYTVIYPGVLVLTALSSEPTPDADSRILSPLYPVVTAILVLLLDRFGRLRSSVALPAAVIVGLVLLTVKGTSGWLTVNRLAADGQGYSSARWRDSQTIATLRILSPETIYTDDIAAVYLLADRYSHSIPRRLDAITRSYLETYPSDLEAMRQRLAKQGGVLVLFAPQDLPGDMAPLEDLTFGMQPIRTLADGVIYAPCPATACP